MMLCWSQMGVPCVAVTNATAATAWIFPLVQWTYTFRRHVDDGDSLGTDTADVSVTVWSRPPAASLTVTPDLARLGAMIHFDGSGSFDPDGSIVNYDFRFGDGSSATGSAASEDHAYTAPGTYLAT